MYGLQVEARPEAKVVWRQGVREVGKGVITDGRESELVLDLVKREELGAYTCAAKNSLGEASALLILPGDLLFLWVADSNIDMHCIGGTLLILSLKNMVKLYIAAAKRVQFTSQFLARCLALQPPWD